MSLSEVCEKNGLPEDVVQAEIDRQKANLLKITRKQPASYRFVCMEMSMIELLKFYYIQI